MNFKDELINKLRDLLVGGFSDKIRSGMIMMLGVNKGLNDKLKENGRLLITLLHPDGTSEYWEFHNTITQLGDALVADAMSDRGVVLPSHIAVGTTSGGKTTASTTLEAELARVALTSTTQGTGGDDNDVVWVGTFPAGTGTGALVEAGIFNDPVAGIMFCFGDFAVINKGALDILTFTWTLTCGAS